MLTDGIFLERSKIDVLPDIFACRVSLKQYVLSALVFIDLT